MSALGPPASRDVSAVSDAVGDESWIADLVGGGAEELVAQRKLQAVLLRASRHQVWRLRGMLPGVSAAELDDLAHQAADDAFVAVLRQLPGFQRRSRFTTWAYKFAILHAGAVVRRQAWRTREVPLPDTVALVDASPSPSELTESHELATAIEGAIRTALTPHQRRVTLALLVEDVPIDVLADRLGTTRNALYKTLHDARTRLRAELAASGQLPTTPPRSPR